MSNMYILNLKRIMKKKKDFGIEILFYAIVIYYIIVYTSNFTFVKELGIKQSVTKSTLVKWHNILNI